MNVVGESEVVITAAEYDALRDCIRISYPMTPVDCLISELRELADCGLLFKASFEERVAQFKDEVAA